MNPEHKVNNEEELSKELKRALLDLTMDTGPWENYGGITLPIRVNYDWVVNASRYLDIPATYQLPTSPKSNNELQNVIETTYYLDVGDSIPFNPVLEYEKYVKLFEMGLVEMKSTQGSKVMEISINQKGARKIGKTLIETKKQNEEIPDNETTRTNNDDIKLIPPHTG